jgi:hypothetical protein
VTDHRTTPTLCPWCHAEHVAALNTTTEDAPGDGDVCICSECGRLSLFDSSVPGGRRFPTLAERRQAEANPDVRRALDAVAALRNQRHTSRPW